MSAQLEIPKSHRFAALCTAMVYFCITLSVISGALWHWAMQSSDFVFFAVNTIFFHSLYWLSLWYAGAIIASLVAFRKNAKLSLLLLVINAVPALWLLIPSR